MRMCEVYFFVLRSAKKIKNDAPSNCFDEKEEKVENGCKPRVYKGYAHIKIQRKRE